MLLKWPPVHTDESYDAVVSLRGLVARRCVCVSSFLLLAHYFTTVNMYEKASHTVLAQTQDRVSMSIV